MIELTLDGAMGMEAIHEQLAQTLHFPDFYGRNLDALYDCLTELREDVTFTVQNVHALGRRGPALQMMLQKAALLNPHIHYHTEASTGKHE